MASLTIQAGKRKTFLTKAVLAYCQHNGLHLYKPLHVATVSPKKMDDNWGYCVDFSDFLGIAVCRGMNDYQFCSILLHELKHAEQYSLGKLASTSKGWRWKGRKMKGHDNDPSEKEAWAYSAKMIAAFFPESENLQ